MLNDRVRFSSSHVKIEVAEGGIGTRTSGDMWLRAEGEGEFSAYRGFEMR
jgi:hypothetical protein